mgnify:CR=1 FL=1
MFLRRGQLYQPLTASILNVRGGASPEVFAASRKQIQRVTIVGQRSTGCLGGTNGAPLGSDAGLLWVVSQEFIGANTGTKYNNVGIQPDVAADDASAVATASKLLLDKIAGR